MRNAALLDGGIHDCSLLFKLYVPMHYEFTFNIADARDEATSSTIVDRKEGSSLDAGMNIHNFVEDETAAMGDEDFRVSGNDEFSEKSVHWRKRCVLYLCLKCSRKQGIPLIVFKVCSCLGSVELWRQLHGLVMKFQFCLNIYLSNGFIDIFGKCGSLDDALQAAY
ncbi:unnamed protein product [Dovyalis caffra]|uniref:Uncharacterized protein n=1 Tax=Dovyalis caffra TaxID=77055 RepID=A0AAV1QRR9_9ROSI|nr:unnamed protein product [Dovyalis caffra]